MHNLPRILSILGAVGGAMMTAGNWGDLLTPQGVGGLLVAAAGAAVGIAGEQPGWARRLMPPKPRL